MAADLGAIESLHRAAFPDEELLPLVRDLLPDISVATSFVGEIDSRKVLGFELESHKNSPLSFYHFLGGAKKAT